MRRGEDGEGEEGGKEEERRDRGFNEKAASEAEWREPDVGDILVDGPASRPPTPWRPLPPHVPYFLMCHISSCAIFPHVPYFLMFPSSVHLRSFSSEAPSLPLDLRVVTLMSNDAQKLQDAAFALHALWGSPCIIIVVLVLLWYQVGGGGGSAGDEWGRGGGA